jgi:hypothetical protein
MPQTTTDGQIVPLSSNRFQQALLTAMLLQLHDQGHLALPQTQIHTT